MSLDSAALKRVQEKCKQQAEQITFLKDELDRFNEILRKSIKENQRLKKYSNNIELENLFNTLRKTASEQAEQITALNRHIDRLEKIDKERRGVVSQQAEQIAALEEAIAENEITTADQQGTLDDLTEQITDKDEIIRYTIGGLEVLKQNDGVMDIDTIIKTLEQALAAQPQKGDSDDI